MNSVRDIISSLNESVCDLIPGINVHGVAELVPRDNQTMPEINEKFVGIDDAYPVRIYHRLLSVTSSIRSGTGMGRSEGDQANTYQVTMVVFLQQHLAKLYPDQLLLYIQSNFPERVDMQPYKSVVVRFLNAQLNSGQVWQEEYSGGTDYRLKSNQFLFKINYSIETTFSKGCFKKCP
jgi:hypothetical protein